MTFTDEDLKRLKTDVANSSGPAVGIALVPDLIATLLARLEAAERILNCSNEGCVIDKKHWTAWRKAAGK